MAPSKEYVEYVLEHLAAIEPVKLSSFFGGIGVTRDAVQFAMIMDNSLYFVVNAETRKKYQNKGMGAFSYMKKSGRVDVHKYYEVPEEILIDSVQLNLWASESFDIAMRSKSTSKNH